MINAGIRKVVFQGDYPDPLALKLFEEAEVVLVRFGGSSCAKKKNIALPKLNNLKPTIESTALKLMEEAGELAQAIGKLQGSFRGNPEVQRTGGRFENNP